MDQQQQYCLKWSNYSSNLATAFSNLFNTETLTDVTLFCEGTIFKAHKLILAACSKNFADLFETPSLATGSVCVILEATSAENMAALLEFMYKGEVHVSQKALESFLKAAESLQVKGLTTEHGRCATNNSNFPQENNAERTPEAAAPTSRRFRNSFSQLDPITKSGIKRETDMIMAGAITSFPTYLPQPYMPSPYEPARKRHMKNLYTNTDQQETRGSVLRDGSKTSTGSPSPISSKTGNYRPASSGSSAAPEADTMQTERDSPQQSNRYENHSPSTTQGNGTSSTSERDERNGTDKATDLNIKHETGAEDLRMKMEMRQLQSPIGPSTAPPTPTTPIAPYSTDRSKGMPVGLEGKKLQCPLCDRQYGYETNLRAHIRQRHQGIRVPCPFCSRTFTRNNTVRRHIAREHKHQQIVTPFTS
ncbi:hypothetical protein PVAND_006001 [Polypedilum vanderplanki]|uniref:Uncharacterized protein n=1 Tax=Polypedilum vanderplanki TaxID=319348 RepID=A0A9J6C2P4_POLVA|nr:hypothetical protein PVAND_006001 [Polypedilum vanderplanki]